eukprot:TRINITY_DN2798_c0_g2_i1.p1 TRINITY_DN2798_c0_g2~~TRINITY_DN2798_c0_g2_i1.p1  ORF type:complete len:571 (+),score=142.68 TRINITY_DN2798_c0_g2_i1:42-1754(+)
MRMQAQRYGSFVLDDDGDDATISSVAQSKQFHQHHNPHQDHRRACSRRSCATGAAIFMIVCLAFYVVIAVANYVSSKSGPSPSSQNASGGGGGIPVIGDQCTGNVSRDYFNSVRVCDGVSQSEKQFVQERVSSVIQPALYRLLGEAVSQADVPKIAIIAGGSGFRASLATLGWLIGSNSTGLFDISSHISTSAGSSWLYFPTTFPQIDFESMGRDLEDSISQSAVFPLTNMTWREVIDYMIKRNQERGQVSIVDWFGRAVALHILHEQPNILNLPLKNALKQSLDFHTAPFPIYVVSDLFGKFYEFTPTEFGSWDMKSWISLDNLDEVFDNGSVIASNPEIDVSAFYGLIGLSRKISPTKIYRKFALDTEAQDQEEIDKLEFALGEQITGFRMTNFLRNLNLNDSSGHNFGAGDMEMVFTNSRSQIPVSSFLTEHRGMDILIVFDASSDGEALCEAASLAKSYQIKFPTIPHCSSEDVSITKISPFEIYYPDESSSEGTPIVIHFSLMEELGANNSDKFDPFKTWYTDEEMDGLTSVGFETVETKFGEILEVVQEVVSKKKSIRTRTAHS